MAKVGDWREGCGGVVEKGKSDSKGGGVVKEHASLGTVY